jgi:hypothetical protein
MFDPDSENSSKPKSSTVNRRNILLAGTALAAAAALPSAAFVQMTWRLGNLSTPKRNPVGSRTLLSSWVTISDGQISVFTIKESWPDERPIWTGWPARECASQTIMLRQAAPPGGRTSFPVNCRFGLA